MCRGQRRSAVQEVSASAESRSAARARLGKSLVEKEGKRWLVSFLAGMAAALVAFGVTYWNEEGASQLPTEARPRSPATNRYREA